MNTTASFVKIPLTSNECLYRKTNLREAYVCFMLKDGSVAQLVRAPL